MQRTTSNMSGMKRHVMIQTLSQPHVVQYHFESQGEHLYKVFRSSHHLFVMLYVSRAPAQTLLSFLSPASADKNVGKARQRIDACEYACGNAAACDILINPSPRHTGCSTEETITYSLGKGIHLTHKSHTIQPEGFPSSAIRRSRYYGYNGALTAESFQGRKNEHHPR